MSAFDVLSWLETVDHPSHYRPDCDDRRDTSISNRNKSATQQRRRCQLSPDCLRTIKSPQRGSPRKRPRKEASSSSDDVFNDEYGHSAPCGATQATPRLLPLRLSPSAALPPAETVEDPFITASSRAPFTNPPNLTLPSRPSKQKQLLVGSHSEGSITGISQGAGSSQQSRSSFKSPIWSVTDMLFFAKPVKYNSCNRSSFPPQVRAISQAVFVLNVHNRGIYPLEIKVHLPVFPQEAHRVKDVLTCIDM